MLLPGYYYHPIYIYSIVFLSIIYIIVHQKESCRDTLSRHNNSFSAIAVGLVYILFFGLRPAHTGQFGDSSNYLEMYEYIRYGLGSYDIEHADWLFGLIMTECAKIMEAKYFFLLIEIGYIGCNYWACKRLMPNNVYGAFLMSLTAYSFYSYSTNGIRNGLACAIMLVVFSYILGSKKDKIIAVILSFCAYNIHHATALPILMMLISAFILSKYKNSLNLTIIFWCFSILLSLTISDVLENFFASLGFDDRLNNYIYNDEWNEQFSHLGFRWDFLIYSILPIIWGYYIIVKKKTSDNMYKMLLNTYILCNSFWIMLIRASFSNRFAYLSWFMYPILLAYPLLRLPIWPKQGTKFNWTLAANTSFTYFMWLIGK